VLRLLLFVLLTAVYGYSYSQNGSYTRCADGIVLSHNNEYHVVFPGKPGPDKSGLYGYGTDELVTKNKIWLFFDPPSTGIINIKTKARGSSFGTYIFKEKTGDICSDLQKRKAQLLVFKSESKELESINLFLLNGLRYAVVLVGEERSKDSLQINIEFSPQDEFGNEIIDSLLFDLTTNYKDKSYSLHIRNERSKKPVKATISFYGSNEINGTYVASDLIMNLKKSIKSCDLKIDAEGYLSFDNEEYSILLREDVSDTIYLKPLVRGTVAKIDEIYFAAGLPTILEESVPKLNRLRDFLLVNPSVNIEIQGHVNGDGKRSFRSKKLSKKRAKNILQYLHKAGISSNRLSAIGFGFTKPVYEHPENEVQKEANRRVEILIK